jgi:hypothetical protein
LGLAIGRVQVEPVNPRLVPEHRVRLHVGTGAEVSYFVLLLLPTLIKIFRPVQLLIYNNAWEFLQQASKIMPLQIITALKSRKRLKGKEKN